MVYVHTTSLTLLTCDISLGSLLLPVPEAGDIVALILLYMCRAREFKQRSSWLEPTACGQVYVMTHAVDTVLKAPVY
jgi:hypothetical protein